jgi:hypothetical protein
MTKSALFFGLFILFLAVILLKPALLDWLLRSLGVDLPQYQHGGRLQRRWPDLDVVVAHARYETESAIWAHTTLWTNQGNGKFTPTLHCLSHTR